jgi:hypothetical protein
VIGKFVRCICFAARSAPMAVGSLIANTPSTVG